jgi:hypothetical protein
LADVLRQAEVPGEEQRANSGGDVEEHRDQLRSQKAVGRHQQEIRQKTTQRSASRVDGVENRDPQATSFEVASNEMPDEERQRPTHQQRDRREQGDGEPDPG